MYVYHIIRKESVSSICMPLNQTGIQNFKNIFKFIQFYFTFLDIQNQPTKKDKTLSFWFKMASTLSVPVTFLRSDLDL